MPDQISDAAPQGTASYHQTPPDDFNVETAASSAIADLAKEFGAMEDPYADVEPDFGDDAEVVLPPAGDAADPALAPKVKVETPAPVVVEPPKESPEVTSGLQRLIEKETALAAREARLADAERNNTQLVRELTDLRARVKQSDDLAAQFRMRPMDALKQLGVSPDVVMALMTAEKLGDKAPPEVRRAAADAQRDWENKELRERIDRQDAQRAESEFWGNQAQVAAAFVRDAKPETFKEFPIVEKLRAKDPLRASNAILWEIHQDARQRLANGEDPRAPLITHQEAARRIQQNFGFWAELGGPTTPEPIVTTQTAAKTPVASKTVGNATDPGLQTPPPKVNRPLKPWQKQADIDLEEAGIRAGIAAAKAADIRHARAMAQ